MTHRQIVSGILAFKDLHNANCLGPDQQLRSLESNLGLLANVHTVGWWE